jgi:hypothetical protein
MESASATGRGRIEAPDRRVREYEEGRRRRAFARRPGSAAAQRTDPSAAKRRRRVEEAVAPRHEEEEPGREDREERRSGTSAPSPSAGSGRRGVEGEALAAMPKSGGSRMRRVTPDRRKRSSLFGIPYSFQKRRSSARRGRRILRGGDPRRALWK